MNFSPLNRAQLAEVFDNHETLKAFEKVFQDTGFTLPSTIEEANALAGDAMAKGFQALSILSDVYSVLDQLASAPFVQQALDADDFTPRAQLGTISRQNHDAVEITGGTIDGTAIGQNTASPGSFTTIAVSSSALVSNLYAARAALADLATNANHASSSDSLTSPSSYPADATDLPTVIALANALKAAAVSKGL